ncbi:MAG: calcium-translocating P-type ATPase, PMCA-type [Victivallaceae bacterium]
MTDQHSDAALPFSGLTTSEVAESRRLNGENLLAKPPRTPWYKQFLGKFNDPIIRILIVAALISGLTGGLIEGIGIALAVFLATGISFFNEYRANKEFDILNQVDDEIPVKTIRDNEFTRLARRELVRGDIIFVETGEEIPADAEVLLATNFHVDQSKFTGEPEPVPKVPKNDPDYAGLEEGTYPHEHLLRGSTVLDGHAYCRIEAVGVATEIGRTALAAATETDLETPLQKQLNGLGKVIALAGTTLAALLFVVLIVLSLHHGTLPAELGAYTDMKTIHVILGFFMLAVTLIVVAVPEGLAMSVTLSLAYSMRRMTADNSLVRKMHACETIGAATVICTDKTGTLTMNRMTVRDLHFPSLENKAVDDLIAEAMAVNSSANLGEDGGVIGNPTEGALLLYLNQTAHSFRKIRREFKIKRQWTFTTERKFMATSGEDILHVKGAPEIVLDRCSDILEPGGVRTLTDADRQSIRAAFAAAQTGGCRTLGFACKRGAVATDDLLDAAQNLTYLGFAAISDPVRPDVPDAVERCRRAGIKIKVVTGDTPGTAREIGRQIGLIDGSESADAVTGGGAFEALDEKATLDAVGKLKIIARARPNDKLKLVRALQHQNEVVAVTGDGTNDAPALNYADVGIAMGQTGTAIAREAADIILLDDSFKSIVNAVLWGRSLYRNIQRFLVFQLTINVAAVGIALIGPFIGAEMPLTVIQMLWVNLIMDTFAALALATEPPDPEVMNEPPRRPDAFIVTPKMAWGIFATAAVFIAIFIFQLLHLKAKAGEEVDAHGLSIFFTTFVMLQFWNLFNAKCFGSSKSIFKRLATNRCFLVIAAGIVAGQVLIVEFGGKLFRTVPLTINEYIVIIGTSSLVLWGGELKRWLERIREGAEVEAENR